MTNEARLRHLANLLRTGDRAAFEKQAWEWVTTGVFGIREFRALLAEAYRVTVRTVPTVVRQVDCPRCGYQEGLP